MRFALIGAGLCLALPTLAADLEPVTPEMIEELEKSGDKLTEEATDSMLQSLGIATPDETDIVDEPDEAASEEEDDTVSEEEDAGPLTPRKAVSVCITCHGLDGIAKIPVAPHLAGESRIYLETQLKAFRSGKRVNEMMTVIAEDMSNEEIKAAAKWYSAIKISVEQPE